MQYAIFATMLALSLAASTRAAEVEVRQKDKKFSHAKVTLKVGDSVSFRNDDNFSHNIFSLSEEKTFDLGSYPQGQSRKVVFEKPGVIEVECAIHPDMKMLVEVKK